MSDQKPEMFQVSGTAAEIQLTAGKRILKKTTFRNAVWTGLKITFVFSLSIESLQLFLRLGTFQVSDLTYNTLGGGIGGAVYWMGYRLTGKRKITLTNQL